MNSVKLPAATTGVAGVNLHRIAWVIMVLLNLCISFSSLGQTARRRITDSLELLFSQERNPDQKIGLALQIANSFPGNSQGDSMLFYSNVAQSLFKQSADSSAHTYYFYYVRVLANTYLGNFKDALRISKLYDPKLNDIYNRIMRGEEADFQNLFKTTTLPSYPFNALGELYRKFGDLELALTYHLKALQCAEKLNNDIRPLADSYNNVGIVYDLLKQYTKAISYYKKAAEINTNADRRQFNLASNYNNMGIVYKNLKKYDSAALYYKLGVQLMEKTSNNYGKAVLLDNIAILYTQQGQYDLAIEVENEALELQRKTGSKEQQAMLMLNLANNYYLKREYSKAEALGLEAYEMSEQNHYLENVKNTGELLYRLYEAKGNHKEALRFHKIFKESADTLLNEAKNETISNLQVRYDTEKKEAENQRLLIANEQQTTLNRMLGGGGILSILLLVSLFYFYRGKQKANRKLEVQNKQIESNLREKESLLREIHHRVKNNLQVISGLLNMQSYHLQDPEMINAIAEGQSRVKAMALIHQKLYQTDQLSEIDFQEYTEQLIGHLDAAFGKQGRTFNREVNGSSLKLDIDTAIPLGLILNELITNSFKYAFTEATVVDLKVDLKLDDEQYYHLHISDSGKGFPDDFNESKLNSLGLKLVRMLVEQLDGALEISNEKGAHFYIRFKKQHIAA
ncbi:MAG: tetratricopeptide repeat-containing sensor histidine kinase [Bacteroidota bacterium]